MKKSKDYSDSEYLMLKSIYPDVDNLLLCDGMSPRFVYQTVLEHAFLNKIEGSIVDDFRDVYHGVFVKGKLYRGDKEFNDIVDTVTEERVLTEYFYNQTCEKHKWDLESSDRENNKTILYFKCWQNQYDGYSFKKVYRDDNGEIKIERL